MSCINPLKTVQPNPPKFLARRNLSRRRLGEGGKTAILAGVAALVAGFVLSLGFYSISAPNESIAGTLVILVFLPSVVICENLGLGHFSIFGPSTIPDWALPTVGISGPIWLVWSLS